MVKLTNPSHKQQGIVFRYCDAAIEGKMNACIIQFRPQLKRFLLKSDLSTTTLSVFVDDYLQNKLKPYLQVERVFNDVQGNMRVDFPYIEPQQPEL